MKLITLTGKRSTGCYTQVDDEDYEELLQYKWHKSCGYAERSVYKGKGPNREHLTEHIKLHRQILKVTDGKLHVDHIDGNPLNNSVLLVLMVNQKII